MAFSKQDRGQLYARSDVSGVDSNVVEGHCVVACAKCEVRLMTSPRRVTEMRIVISK